MAYAAIAITSISVAWHFYARSRTWPVAEVPIAFWSWRNQSPAQADVLDAIEKTKATRIFLRAGQIDRDGTLRRIRPLSGSFPRGIELHLVYNTTRVVLEQFENVDPQSLATAIHNAYREDSERAKQDHANITGLQLDIDVPTRLLPLYEKTLIALRRDLEPNTQLSITGLPTWMESPELVHVLKQVDFWVPQFYGAEIPQRSDQKIPISSPQTTAHFVRRARQLERPFYAGLAAYSVAMLYDPSGALINLRGDLDPVTLASDPNLEPTDRQSFDNATGEWRYVFRARSDGVTDDLAMRAGDILVVDLPSSESLRAAARIVREQAGKKLLGICVFRLPAHNDPATLTAEQVHTALEDRDSSALIDIRIKRSATNYTLELKNAGTASALLGTLEVDLALTPGSFDTVKSELFETLCTTKSSPRPCTQRRADLIRLTPKALPAGHTLKTIVVLNREPPATIPVSLTMLTDTGSTYSIHRDVSVETGVSQ